MMTTITLDREKIEKQRLAILTEILKHYDLSEVDKKTLQELAKEATLNAFRAKDDQQQIAILEEICLEILTNAPSQLLTMGILGVKTDACLNHIRNEGIKLLQPYRREQDD